MTQLGKGYSSLLEANKVPVAVIVPDEQQAVVGAIVKLDGRLSFDPEGKGLTYQWAFSQVPIGSQVEKFGFTPLDPDSTMVSFAPDLTGTYKVELVVMDPTLPSEPTEAIIDARVILVPHHQGFIPDASFIWNYLSDFWTLVDGRKKFETFWSGAIQIAATEMLKLYQYDYNKSIKDIQDVIQKRWLAYEPALTLDPSTISFIIADDRAGSKGMSFVLDSTTGDPLDPQPVFTDFIGVPKVEGDLEISPASVTPAKGKVIHLGRRSYTVTSYSEINRDIPLSGLLPYNALTCDQEVVPTKQDNKTWRISATMISSTLDFETSGVSPGDTIDIEITRPDVALSATFQGQVVSVDRNRLGYVLNVNQLVDGQPGGWLSQPAQIGLANGLQVPGLFIGQNRSLVYTDQAALVLNTVTSFKFRRTYFEKELTPSSIIDVGAFSITVKPLKVTRNKHIPVDQTVKSVPVLQEYIRQPEVSVDENGITQITTEGGTIPAARPPLLLNENLDYIIDNETQIKGVCTTVAGDDEVEVPFGDLVDRSVSEGDSVYITFGGRETLFTVVRVLTPERLRITPVAPYSETLTSYRLKRRVGGNYIRFIDGTFSPANPAPSRFWSEVTYFDNGENIENNFGVLVGLTRETVETTNATTPYKSAVAGLMYALATGPTVSNMQLSAQILLGLPFTQFAGVITEINPDYKKNDDGSPQYGRILVEARDKDDTPIGVTNIYLYPQGRQIPEPTAPLGFVPAVPEFSGLAINPDTGKEYAVGDHVSQFAILSKGVQIEEYIGTPDWFKILATGNPGLAVQIYHSFNLRMNSDLTSAADIDLVASFIKKARPTYTLMKAILVKDVEDDVIVDDQIFLKLLMKFFDNDSGSLASAVKFDHRDADDSFVALPGVAMARLMSGDDLATTQGSALVNSASGGFINPRPSLGESHDTPFVKANDVAYILSGPNAGHYPILGVNSDTQIILGSTGTFQTITPDPNPTINPRQPFVIYRPQQNPLWVGHIAVTQTNDTVTITDNGILSAGVAVGDILVFKLTGKQSHQYTVVTVSNNLLGQSVQVMPAIKETTGTYYSMFVREQLITNDLTLGMHPSFVGSTLNANLTSGSFLAQFVDPTDWLVLALARPGDLLAAGTNIYTVLRNDPDNSRLIIHPAAQANYSGEVVLTRPTRSSTVISDDILDRFPSDYLELDLLLKPTGTGKLVTVSGSAAVHTTDTINFQQLGAKVGDYIVILEGPDSTVDNGMGPGVFLILNFTSTTILSCASNFTSSGNVRWGIRKKRPNEG